MINAQPDLGVVAEATSGKEALEKLKETSADVMLLDLYLPDMSGLDVLRYARSHYPHTKILVLSSYPEAQFGLLAINLHAPLADQFFTGAPGTNSSLGEEFLEAEIGG